MSHRSAAIRKLAFLAALLLSTAAQAQLFRAYLASDGLDANPCTLQQPCRLLPAALAAVASGGEIWMLDSANYNTTTVTIGKSVTILAVPGVVGSVVTPVSGNAINITAASLEVSLRNLVIVPLPLANGHGIEMTGASKLMVQDCQFSGLQQVALLAWAGTVVVEGSTFRGNGSGVYVLGNTAAVVTRSTIVDNEDYGVIALNTIASTTSTLEVSDSVIQGGLTCVGAVGNGASSIVSVVVSGSRISGCTFGAASQHGGSASATLNATNNTISHNGTAGLITFGGKLFASGNSVHANTTGLKNDSGIFESAGNNAVRNNGTPTAGTITPVGLN